MSMESVGGGHTKEHVSGWTVDTLHAHIMTVLEEREKRWLGMRAERDERYMAKFAAAETAVNKAEDGLTAWKTTTNEWRGAMQDKDKLLMSRQEITSEVNSVRSELAILRTGVSALRNLSLSAILVACAVITVVLLLLRPH